ncbi:MAG: hypothetical protein HUJ54_00240 [Erysipelotrichaceae bacterium]|nr:hypothetical protein [Erysipelotrichaceae bacterium]
METSNYLELEKLQGTNHLNGKQLFRITDKNSIARLDQMIPGLANAILNTANAANFSGVYKAILPSGKELINVKNSTDLYRGMYQDGTQIGGHAIFKQAGDAAANMAASLLNITSMLVGQYYLSEINKKMDTIQSALSAIKDFQETDFESDVKGMVTEIQEMTQFKKEIFEKEQLRTVQLNKIAFQKSKCNKLLYQVRALIQKQINSKPESYAKYQESLKIIDQWGTYHKILFACLGHLSELEFTFYAGEVSREYCSNLFNVQKPDVHGTHERIKVWSIETCKDFGIDLSNQRRDAAWEKKVLAHGLGILGGAFTAIPMVIFQDSWKFEPLQEVEINYINRQMEGTRNLYQSPQDDFYQKDKELIVKNGLLYLAA